MSLSAGGFGGLWADVRAPPASAAAEPVRKPRREVNGLLSFPSRYVPSLIYSLSFTFGTMLAARLFISDRLTSPVFPLSAMRASEETSTGGSKPLYRGPDSFPILATTNVGADPDHNAPTEISSPARGPPTKSGRCVRRDARLCAQAYNASQSEWPLERRGSAHDRSLRHGFHYRGALVRGPGQ